MKDNFSVQADLYAQYRPDYPQELYDLLLINTPNSEFAWDCATGNGQVAVVLANFFEKIEATDISQKQLDKAPPHPNITYSVCPAEKTPFPGHIFDLVTVAQALHWFKFDDFFKELKRVAKPNATVAFWGYEVNHVSPEVDAIVDDFYNNIVGPYWDSERKHIENRYADVKFSLNDLKDYEFSMQKHWSFEQYVGYYNTWSSVQHFIKVNDYNPVEQLAEKMKEFWPDNEVKTVTFPVFLKIGKV
jgi:ubiquinone/menaquinone biosynthesis C-methylase UbiE